MFNKRDLQKTPEFWLETIQNEVYQQVVEYMKKQGINQTELAEKLGVSKGYISQILKGQFNYTLKKLIELSLEMGKVPNLQFEKFEDFVANEEKKKSDLPSFVVIYSSNSIAQQNHYRDGNVHSNFPASLNAKKSLEEKYGVFKHRTVRRSFNHEKTLISF